ncbi:DNA-binding CsgD family transcriptional regulator [Filimonas zeae]|uniref:Helix-turn-helix transcriptional regulator n=1 Tax=Filimonas zeae TaxID=1737353 RepID=A0A917IL89_9BACT|nr:LuxR C-terminal-related transcriptional regulator [Filimonas zeae]MDR6337107.1 DNA-binding CsgD family transcriptional regulator [Filimonas zeae]GGH57034.1 helix-turn-helix transcriptional regulator [Filimonas zeae]
MAERSLLAVKDQLSAALLQQTFTVAEQTEAVIEEYKRLMEAYVRIEEGIAVLSDFAADCSYMQAGSFGSLLGIPAGASLLDSAFEDCIFNVLHAEDLVARHVQELRYFQYQKTIPVNERPKYSTFCRVRIRSANGYAYINHRTFYLKSLSNGSVWLALCLYTPSADTNPRAGIDGRIINNETGEVLAPEQYKQYDQTLLSKRETEVLALVAQGRGSKEIAEQLHIAVHTVHRHRQNIIQKMQVANTAEAVLTALNMGLITS